MKDELGAAGAMIGSFVIASLLAGLALAIYPGWPAVRAWLEAPSAPAWVQAVGSVAAILVALLLPYIDRARQKRENVALLESFSTYLIGILAAVVKKTPAVGISLAVHGQELTLGL